MDASSYLDFPEMQGNRLAHTVRPQFAASLSLRRRPHPVNTTPSRCGKRGSTSIRQIVPAAPAGEGGQGCAHMAVAVSGARLKARRRGGLVLLTMSTPAPALVITTPTEVGGAPSMLSEVSRGRGAASAWRDAARGRWLSEPAICRGPHGIETAPCAQAAIGVSVFGDATFMSYARSPRREPARQADLAAGPVPDGSHDERPVGQQIGNQEQRRSVTYVTN